ncbi:MAG TPA: ribonuclease domain-containing protein [Atopostipes sp.]|nr:ribonuclease domain-containing protein [Atopostipes sp.]
MMKQLKHWFLSFMLLVMMAACGTVQTPEEIDTLDTETFSDTEDVSVQEGEPYTGAQEVVDYLDAYGELPPNYLTKEEARELGWEASEGNLWDVAPEASIGGDYFGNFEGLLPEAEERDYFEADINYEGGYRNAERLVFSNDGLYFYTEDHYESFEELEPGGGKNENNGD